LIALKRGKQIIADLDAEDLLEKIADHKLMVPRGDRTHSVIEPLLTDQWYVKSGRWRNLRLPQLKTATSNLSPTTGKHLF